MRPVYDPTQEETYHIAGDVGPTATPGKVGHGMSATMNFAAGDRVRELAFRFEDKIVYADLYITHDADGTEIMLHWMCPKCAHAGRITSKKKDMHWDGEYLSVAPFECSWEMDNEREGINPSMGPGGSVPGRVGEAAPPAAPTILISSNNLCRLKLAIDRNKVRRA